MATFCEQQQEVIPLVMVEYALGLMAHISVTTDAVVTELCIATERLFWKIHLHEGHLYWSHVNKYLHNILIKYVAG